jgi:DNA-binding MarR family transcriptional regulator
LNSIYPEIGCIMMAYDKKFKVFMKNALKDRNLSVAEALVLLSLYDTDGQTQDMLLSSIYYDKSVMARTMKALEERKFISRSSNPDDGRSWLFHLTESGRELKPEIVQALRDWCSLVFDGMDEARSAEMLGLLREIYVNINKE